MQRIIGKINRHGEADRVIAEARPGTVNAHRASLDHDSRLDDWPNGGLLVRRPRKARPTCDLAASVIERLRRWLSGIA